MRQIEVTESDFGRLQDIAVPFIDTPATVIAKLLDERERAAAKPTPKAAGQPLDDVQVFGPTSIPPLTHTKVMSASFDQRSPDRANWDSLVRLSLLRTKVRFSAIDDLRRVSGANLVSGRKSDEGYKPADGAGFSYQGLSAEDAVKVVVRCARALGCPFNVEFVWRDKEGAHRPGGRGIIQFSPS